MVRTDSHPLLRTFRGAALHVARWTGLTRRVGRTRWRDDRLLILCYHGVSKSDEHEWSDLYVSQAHLESRLELLRRESCHILPLNEALQRLQNGSLPPRSVALTFDDGAHDFLTHAEPVLARFDAPATIYLTSYYSRYRLPVFDPAISYVFWKGRGKLARWPDIDDNAPFRIPSDDAGRRRIVDRIREAAHTRGLDAHGLDGIVENIAAQVGVDYESLKRQRLFQLLSPDDLGQLDRSRVSLELHTHSHHIPVDRTEFHRSLEQNKHFAANGVPTDGERRWHFCYPNGLHSAASKEMLRSFGIASATTCEPRLASAEDDPLLLPRVIDSMSISETVFLGWIHGPSHLTRRRSR